MTVTGTHVRSSWRGGVAWGAFFASWGGGWLLDGFTASVYAFVALPATQYLLPASHIPPLKYESFFLAAFFSVFLIGWGTAFIFGPLGDRYGRFRVLAISIALYGVGSVLSGLSTNAYEFMAFRFITGLGIGAEWFVGGTSVAEIFPEDRRVFGAGLFHSGYYFGYFFAALAALFLQSIIGFRGHAHPRRNTGGLHNVHKVHNKGA
ncbi:MFS transporter [Thermogymnomonas acidicola]|uniref:MFS transporter n=1 Tax=Thermogymnomonas acidicola TaxID=399579 RepID=UPI001396C8BD|nr:MFS transporter [Thermogymnomonas acidicola]